MAPIVQRCTGITPQILEDEQLKRLLDDLNGITIIQSSSSDDNHDETVVPPVDCERVVSIVEPYSAVWEFEEQVDLHNWIHALNVLDAALRWLISRNPGLLLIPAVERKQPSAAFASAASAPSTTGCADSFQDVSAVPARTVVRPCRVLVQFLGVLLRNCSSKSIFNGVEELVDLLAAAEDALAAAALYTLQAVSLPPALHKQPQADLQQQHAAGNVTALHNSKTPTVHARILATARGQGTRAVGLGLAAMVTADDSAAGQGSLPQEAGQVHYSYWNTAVAEDDADADDESQLVRIALTESEILQSDPGTESDATSVSMDDASNNSKSAEEDSSAKSKTKRRRVSATTRSDSKKRCVRSTAECWFLAIQKVGGRDKIPPDRQFGLLAEIRTARSFYSRQTRCEAVQRRLAAVTTCLYTHPSQEILSGYFQAQPELCVEMVDLLRPTVSSNAVSATSATSLQQQPIHQDAIAAMAADEPAPIPFGVRMQAVECLTAVVSRRDGGGAGSLSGSARLSAVLTELGVAKGQYLGLLPTLIRYATAALGAMVQKNKGKTTGMDTSDTKDANISASVDIGLAFCEATAAAGQGTVVRSQQVERALEFMDAVLQLAAAVVSTPTGTSALTDCGLIPALLSVVSLEADAVLHGLLTSSSIDVQPPRTIGRIQAAVRFLTAAAVQILEGTVVTHSNALTAFHDLSGSAVLIHRLAAEIKNTQPEQSDAMDTTEDDSIGPPPRLLSSQRVLLFSIVTCLTVVFHQESTSSQQAGTLSGGTELRKPELTAALTQMMDHCNVFGGHLCSLAATLLSDVMNSDPHVVHYVHKVGIASAFLRMVSRTTPNPETGLEEPIVPAVPELIMALPNVISALSLTEDGAKAVEQADPFPALMAIFYCPKYAMPHSRCLLNEMTAIVGTGLDEIMRHVERLKKLVLKAIADAMQNVVTIAEDLCAREDAAFLTPGSVQVSDDERSCLIQYVLNFGQLLEQILHNEDHVEPFVQAGGLDALVKLFPAAQPSGVQFLMAVSTLSSPAVSTLHHSTTEESLALAMKCIEIRYQPLELLRSLTAATRQHLETAERLQQELFERDTPAFGLDEFPDRPIYELTDESKDDPEQLQRLLKQAEYLRAVSTVQWITSQLATGIKAACQRSAETGMGWGHSEREWKKELSSPDFQSLVRRLASLSQDAIFEACRVRTSEGFERREKARYTDKTDKVCFKLRIVCPEGAVLRDGIEIDSAASVGSMEMGEVAISTDRCVNSCGILRYRTTRGWVSEMTRGHGREPIAEVVSVWKASDKDDVAMTDSKDKEDDKKQDNRRMEAAVPDLRTAAAGVLARVQNSHSELFSALSKLVIQGIRSLPVRTLSFDQGTPGAHVATTMHVLSDSIMKGLNQQDVATVVLRPSEQAGISPAGTAMYLGCLLTQLQACLFDDKRERRMTNFSLLVSLVRSDSWASGMVNKDITAGKDGAAKDDDEPTTVGMFAAVRFVLMHALNDFAARSKVEDASAGGDEEGAEPRQRVDRSVAASFPPTISLLRRLISTPLASSPAASIMSRIKWKDVPKLIGDGDDSKPIEFGGSQNDPTSYFQPEQLVRCLRRTVSTVVKDTWLDERMVCAPSFLVHPVASLVGDILVALEEASKKKNGESSSRSDTSNSSSGGLLLSDYFRERRRQEVADNEEEEEEEEFEASEDVITRLTEMGFTRDHALDALETTRSNRVEVAMEYALSHPPPTAATVERRRAEREERAQRRAEQQRQQSNGTATATAGANSAAGPQESADGNATGTSNPVNDGNNATNPNNGTNGDGTAESSDAQNHGSTDRTEAESGTEAMDVEPSEQATSSTDKKDSSGKESEWAKTELASWMKDLPSVSCHLLGGMSTTSYHSSSAKGDGDGEVEALTTVVCSFLLDLCHRYPDHREKIVATVLKQLKSKLTAGENNAWSILDKDETSAAALVHAAVLFTRALPKTRTLVLKEDLARPLLSCIHAPRRKPWPMWLAPSLLLLDIMTQPVVAFSNEELESAESGEGEYEQVRLEHKNQAHEISDMANKIVAALSTPTQEGDKKDSKKDAVTTENTKPNSTNDEKTKSNEGTDEDESKTPFSSVPAYFPFLPLDSVESCLEICLNLLGSGDRGDVAPPPGVTHAALLLLLRLLRTPKVSTQCLRMGVAEAILSLPRKCRFTGNTGLTTLIFRRLLEDEATLQTSMETEIRSTVTKLHSKQKTPAQTEKTSIALRPFIEAVTPLLCRDPVSFLKAMALTVRVEPSPKKGSKDSVVVLLSAEERTSNKGVLSDMFGHPKGDANRKDLNSSRHRLSSSSNGKGKNQHKNSKRGSPAKKGRKSDTPKSGSQPSMTPPATHVTCLLINGIMASVVAENGEAFDDEAGFLWTGNCLEILADLVLAVPACASAVHNYRPHRRDKWTRNARNTLPVHALAGCPPPPKTFCSFLLHSLLPQDRWSIRNDPQIWDRRGKDDNEELASSIKAKKKGAYRLTKLSQAAARVLVALVARPGEGRKRVIADLTFALSGGQLGHSSGSLATTPPKHIMASANELFALQAWGELALGLAAPRSNGKNVEGLHSMSLENVRIMFEYGMAHALLYSIHRVRLFHPMACSTCGALLLPFELLTRGNVVDGVKELVEKDSKSSSDEPKVEHVEMEPAFRQNSNENDDENDMMVDAEEDEMDEHTDDMEMDGGEEASGDDEEGDEMSSSSDEDSDDESSDQEESESDGGGEGSDMEDSDEMPSEEVEDEGDWNVDYNDALASDEQGGDQQAPEDGEEDVTDRLEQGLDEGWTRIESTGFGGMLLGGRRNMPPSMGGPNGDQSARTRGFIDAAEAMIGTLLRTGEINGDALAEIEGTLGIRIMSNSRALRATLGGDGGGLGNSLAVRVLGGGGPEGSGGPPDPGRRGDVIGTLPHIHQRSQPDVGYSAFGSGGRWIEVSSMEYVFGGPSVTAGSRNYDLISPVRNEPDQDPHPGMSQLDLQLFPGGPASAASARTQHALHPLLCGVDLPPVNSLVSDLLPHGVRATRRGQMTTRRPGDWTNASFSPGGYLVSTSNGNIIRSNRSHSGAPLGSGLSARHVAGPVGWTDDGLPFDATVEEFSSAFERALGESARAPNDSSDGSTPERASGAASSGEARSVLERIGELSNDTADEEPDTADEEPVTSEATDAERNNETSGAETEAEVENQQPNPDSDRSTQEADGSPSEGDRVASSLAAGLRLSPRSDGSGSQMSTADVGNDGAAPDAAMDEASSDMHEVESSTDAQAQPDSAPSPEEEGEENAGTSEELAEGDEPVGSDSQPAPNGNGLVCPPDIDPEVFNSLPLEMQQDCVDQHNATQELAAQIDGTALDPEVLAALPEEMRREVIEQERREREMREQQEQAPADPAHAEEMDNASFIASLAPELREEILLTAEEAFLSSLPPNIVAEAQILRERASVQNRRLYEDAVAHANRDDDNDQNAGPGGAPQRAPQGSQRQESGSSSKRKQRSGKMRVELDRKHVVYLPESLSDPIAKSDVKALIRLLYLLSPVRPPRLLQRVFQNLCANGSLRNALSTAFVKLLHEDGKGALAAVEALEKDYGTDDDWRRAMDERFNDVSEFPPNMLLGAAPEVPDVEAFNFSISASLLRRKHGMGTAASIAANLPTSAGGSRNDSNLPPVVAARLVETILQLSKNSPRFGLYSLVSPVFEEGSSEVTSTCFEKLLDLLDKPMYSKSSANLEQLLTLLESAVSSLSHLSKHDEEEIEIPQSDIDSAAASGREWVNVPRVTVSQERLQLLCSILRMETCRDTAFTKVNTIVRRLCRVETNRGFVLAELASVAHALGTDVVRDLKALRIRMDDAVEQHQKHMAVSEDSAGKENGTNSHRPGLGAAGAISSSVTLSTSTSELKLLRVLQTLQALCGDSPEDSSTKKHEGSVIVTEELVHLLRQLQFDGLWDELSSCLKVVQVLEGVNTFDEEDEKAEEEGENNDDASGDGSGAKKLRNSAAGLLTRFLPSIEAFFVANASATRPKDKPTDGDSSPARNQDISLDKLVEGKRLMQFVSTNKVLLNALVRNNSGLLDKGLRALVQVPRCRVFLDFDVKRQWFKTQVRRLRQQASRRHGSLRLHIRRKHVFEDAYHQLRLRNADEMRGRLHITFRNEEGVDAGGLSREFFGILAKEMFNPNYALFTSTEDGCTFQPNPNSSINPDHLSYFRFVGRIVGKAVADGFLLDAHFTRSLYKHMLGLEPTHHDMEAIDPDYYKNLKMILEYNLSDIGLDLTFSIEDHSFGRSQVIDLVPNGRTVHVTEETKEEYVRLVCHHRMTSAIESQIKAYLDGFYELVSPELIAIFTPRELELLISGLPDIDVHDLKKNTDYVGWKATDKEIEWFWNIMFSLSRNEKAAFLQFVTGSSKVPLAGFSEIQGMRGVQKFSIHKVGGTKGALMSAHTCFNSLDLPSYSSEEEMREKLLLATTEGGGAFLFA